MFEDLFNERPFVERNGQGQIFLIDGGTGARTLVNPQVLREENTSSSTNPQTSEGKQLFKLVTVRKLGRKTLLEVQNLFNQSRANIERAALLAGVAIPYPQSPPQSIDEVAQFYAVYVDEDLDSNSAPVYVYSSTSGRVKVFINALGVAAKDYTVDIAHYEDNQVSPDGSLYSRWRLLHYNARDNVAYALVSDDLPKCFRENYGIESIQYLGGGSWTGIAVTEEDKIQILGYVPKNAPQGTYKLTHRRSTRGVVYHSTTPSYCFSWNRGQLQINYRTRSAKQTYDTGFLLQNSVFRMLKESNYELEIPYRVGVPAASVTPLSFTEFSNSQSSYVGSTNSLVNSPFQSPDFGTDKLRYALESYTQNSNVTRVVTNDWSIQGALKSVQQSNTFPLVQSSSAFAQVLFKVKVATAKGDINHPFQIKATAGSRGISHFYYYKLWWAYGRVIDVYAFGDDNIYRRNRISGDLFPIGKFGVPSISTVHKNAIETPWDAEEPAALFTPSEGLLNFMLIYNSPPLAGHQGGYYYHLNPLGGDVYSLAIANGIDPITSSIGTFGLSGSFVDGGDASTRLRNAQSAYAQIIGDI